VVRYPLLSPTCPWFVEVKLHLGLRSRRKCSDSWLVIRTNQLNWCLEIFIFQLNIEQSTVVHWDLITLGTRSTSPQLGGCETAASLSTWSPLISCSWFSGFALIPLIDCTLVVRLIVDEVYFLLGNWFDPRQTAERGPWRVPCDALCMFELFKSTIRGYIP